MPAWGDHPAAVRDVPPAGLWAFLARHCVSPHTDKAPPLLTLLAWTAWRQGDIPSVRVALRHVLTDQPGYRMAELLHAAINVSADQTGSKVRLPG